MKLYVQYEKPREISVSEFKRDMPFYKVINQFEEHNGMHYKTGLNVDILPFDPSGSCNPGGLYFTCEDILSFLDYGPWLREVTIPEDAKVYRDPGDNETKWKADKIILGERREITANVIIELLDQGATVDDDVNLNLTRFAIRTKSVELLNKLSSGQPWWADVFIRLAINVGDKNTLCKVLELYADSVTSESDMCSCLALAEDRRDLFEEVLRAFYWNVEEIKGYFYHFYPDILYKFDKCVADLKYI
jgi:hypothetical protein